jgi:hypothetical protein
MVIVSLGLVGWVVINRWQHALRIATPFAMGWVFSSVAYIAVPLSVTETHRLEIAPILLGMALLGLAKSCSARDPRTTAPQLLGRVISVHAVGICASFLLWLVFRHFYGDSWRDLLDRTWPIGAVALVLLLANSLMTTKTRARIAMICTALILLFLSLVRGSVV